LEERQMGESEAAWCIWLLGYRIDGLAEVIDHTFEE